MSDLPEYIILDFETTGLDPKKDEIIEIGAIHVKGLNKLSVFHTLVKPNQKVPKVIEELTGITQDMLVDAPAFEEVAASFAEYLGEYPIVAHHSALEQSFLDVHLSPKVGGRIFHVENSIDAFAMGLPEHSSHSMESLRVFFKIALEGSHRADQDCEDLLTLLQKLHAQLQIERPQIKTLVQKLLPDWWWSWFFESLEDSSTLSKQSKAQPFSDWASFLNQNRTGNLHALQEHDEDRSDIAWKDSTSSERIRPFLTQPTDLIAHRESQVKMAETIADAIQKGQTIAIEAPTGTGKSLGYLLPAAQAALSTHVPVVISTHSKTLQDQILHKDIATTAALLGQTDLKATTVKGQENYLCLRKFHQFLLQASESESSLGERWSAVYLTFLTTLQNSVEIDRISPYIQTLHPELSHALSQVRSHYTTTKGKGACPFYESCHFFTSARLAHQSHIVVANHSLVFHWPEHMPKLRTVVFDEAHHLEDQLTQVHQLELVDEDLALMMDRLRTKANQKRASDGNKITQFLSEIKINSSTNLSATALAIATALQEISQHALPACFARKNRRSHDFEDHVPLNRKDLTQDLFWESIDLILNSLRSLDDYFTQAKEACAGNGGMTSHPTYDLITTYQFKIAEVILTLDTLSDLSNDTTLLKTLFWNAKEKTFRISIDPIDVKTYGEAFGKDKHSVILTSATLTSAQDPEWLMKRVGLTLSAPLLKLPSPFQLDQQAHVYLPQEVAAPGTAGHNDALIDFTAQVTQILQGRTLLLMTANSRLKHAAEKLRDILEPRGIQVFDSLSDKRAIENFKVTPRSLLIGSERYGEGIDLPGNQLVCVVIEKINEAMTRGPLAEERKKRTKFALFDYDFPKRMIWLKQRVGRLIRTPIDKGVIVVFDSRYHGWQPPSRQFVDRTLAPMPIITGTRDFILKSIEDLKL